MGAIDKDRHRPWLAYALEESLERSLLAPRDVIDHANPEVLVTQLPASVISELLARALSMGTFSPAQVLESAPPALLAEHLDPDVMWRCLKEAADRGGLSRKGGARSNPARQWFASVLARALESELITPADVIRYLPPAEFVAETPKPVLAEMIKEALSRSTFDPALVLQHVTPEVIAENLETSLVWDCICEAAVRHFELGAANAGAGAGASRGAEPTPVKTAVTAAIAVPSIKPAAKPIEKEKEKPAAEKRATGLPEKAATMPPTAALGVGPGVPRATITGTPSAANRATSATAAAPAPAAAATPTVASAAAKPAATEWNPADDLDVLDDQPLPFPLPR
jgi:hypothetical protein